FRKKGRNYRLASDRSVAVLNIQASKWNEGSSGRFTVNLGVHWPEIARLMDGPIVGDEPKEYECTLRTRIGSLMPGNLDRWWDINEHTVDHLLAAEIVEVVKRFGLPWLFRMVEPHGVKSELEKQERYWERAALALSEKN